MTLYVPQAFVRYYRRKIHKKPEKYSNITKELERARYGLTSARLLALSLFYGILAFIPGILLGYLVSILLPYIETITLYGITITYNSARALICLLFALLAYVVTRYLIISFPYYLSNLRKGRIDAGIPHVINMMLGMAKGGVPLLTIFKFIAENKQVFDEISTEFAKIVELVEVFGHDITYAMGYVADTTPSEKLKVFLENFINVYEGGGDIIEYLRAKSEQYLVEREKFYDIFFETLQVFAEIYLALFIVAPLFFLTILVVFQMIQGEVLEKYRLAMYLLIPAGSIIVIGLIHLAVPREPSGVGRKVEFTEKIEAKVSGKETGFTVSKFRRKINRIRRFLLTPFTEPVYSLTLRAVIFYLLLPPIAFLFLAYGKVDLDQLIFGVLVIGILPLIIFVEYKEMMIRKMERNLPELLKQLASLNEAGLNVVEALKHITELELGVLAREIKRIKREIEWGELVTTALQKLELRVRSPIFSRVLSLVVRAIESTPSVKDALMTASIYSEMEIDASDRIRAQMNIYIIIIYLAFGVFLYTSYVLINNILSIFTTIESVPVTMIAGLDVNAVKRTFFETSVLVATFSGVTAGVLSEGKIVAGLKHVFIFMVVVYVFYRYIVP
jgi:flagellar protein FlaJ